MKYAIGCVLGFLCACMVQECHDYRNHLQVIHGCP